MDLLKVTTLALFVVLSSCDSRDCALPAGWVRPSTVKLARVQVTPYPLFYGQETRPGSWSWRPPVNSSMIAATPVRSGTYEEFLKQVASVSRLNPRPTLLFKFADGQSCSQLNAKRERI